VGNVFESAKASSFASCHLEGEDRALSSYMSFYLVGVGHAANLETKKKENSRENVSYVKGSM